jgi:carbonic anhydrase
MIKFAVFLGLSQANEWDYAQHGSDWGSIEGYEACNGQNQSPIDLKTEGYREYNKHDDEIVKLYDN